jgi:S-adenosylmethionine hydrolase
VAAIITLTSDFGTRDSYVAEMKAVILDLARDARLIDVTHEIEPQNVAEGALVVEALERFPAGSIHLVVVDPGVGTERRGLVVTAGPHVYVGPDNGVLTAAVTRPGCEAHELTAADLRLPVVSRTFHGRDVFAPAAAHLARGVPASRFGPRVLDPVRLSWPRARTSARGVEGEVIHVDRFGNLVTSIDAASVQALVGEAPVIVRIRNLILPLVGTYGDLRTGQAGGLIGSRGRLEVAVRDGSAAARIRAGRGARVMVSRTRTRSSKAPRAPGPPARRS